MENGGGMAFVKLTIVSLIILGGFFGFIVYSEYGGFGFENGITGNLIRDNLINDIGSWDSNTKILFFSQFPIIILIISLVMYRSVKKKKRSREITREDIISNTGPNQTDLDILYNILKKKDKIHISSIQKSFNIDKNIAMEWCKTLESSNMASIEYPTLGEPYIELKVKPKIEIKSNVYNEKQNNIPVNNEQKNNLLISKEENRNNMNHKKLGNKRIIREK